MRSPITRHSIWQVGVDAGLVALAWWLAWNLRFESRPVYYDRYLYWSIVLLVVGIKLPVFALSGFYNRQGDFDKTMEPLHRAADLTPENPKGYHLVAT